MSTLLPTPTASASVSVSFLDMKLIALVLTGWMPIAAGLVAMTSDLAVDTAKSPHVHQGAAETQTTRTATVIFLRHAEALPRTRANQNPVLAKTGQARAALEARTLRAAGVTRIFATELKRTQQTAAPLAKLLELDVEQYAAGRSKEFAATLKELKNGEVVVVVGHSNTVPQMVKELGGSMTQLDKKGYIEDTQHDRMIVQVLSSNKATEPMRALQTLDLRIN